MLDWLYSKTFAGALPALLLLATVMAYLGIAQEGARTVALDAVCATIADTIQSVSSSTGDVWRNLTFAPPGLVIPRYVGYHAYVIHLAMDTVWLDRGNTRVTRGLPGHVHLWNPEDVMDEDQVAGTANVPWPELNDTDAEDDHRTWEGSSDELPHGLAVRGLDLVVSGRRVHHTFVYPLDRPSV